MIIKTFKNKISKYYFCLISSIYEVINMKVNAKQGEMEFKK